MPQAQLQLALGTEREQVGLVELVAVQLLDGDRRAVELREPHLAEYAAAELGAGDVRARSRGRGAAKQCARAAVQQATAS